MKWRLILLMSLTWSILVHAQEENKDLGNYYWVDLNLGFSSFGTDYINAGLGVNVAVDHYLFSFDTQAYSDFNFGGYCGNGEDRLETYSLYGGYIHKRQFGFLYGKAGLSYAKYQEVIGIIPGTGWFECTDYIYQTRHLPAISLEVGAALKYKVVALQFYSSVNLNAGRPVANIGLKLGLGDFL